MKTVLLVRLMGVILKYKFPEATQGTTLQAGLFTDSTLGLLTLFCNIYLAKYHLTRKSCWISKVGQQCYIQYYQWVYFSAKL